MKDRGLLMKSGRTLHLPFVALLTLFAGPTEAYVFSNFRSSTNVEDRRGEPDAQQTLAQYAEETAADKFPSSCPLPKDVKKQMADLGQRLSMAPSLISLRASFFKDLAERWDAFTQAASMKPGVCRMLGDAQLIEVAKIYQSLQEYQNKTEEAHGGALDRQAGALMKALAEAQAAPSLRGLVSRLASSCPSQTRDYQDVLKIYRGQAIDFRVLLLTYQTRLVRVMVARQISPDNGDSCSGPPPEGTSQPRTAVKK